ncbi:hypothetical protein [Elioraea sp.]|uniref:hypothetical protein n=1 Tax=Elioraea sp. TaxID=2185103 RepID=UPI0025C3CC57|nr:hypothetical protein [Elioraea sp.]
MRLWTAMLGAWLSAESGLAAGPGTANAGGQASGGQVRELPRALPPISPPATAAGAEEQAPAPIRPEAPHQDLRPDFGRP